MNASVKEAFSMTEFSSHAATAPAQTASGEKSGATAKTLVFLAVFVAVFCLFSIPMGVSNALNTIMNTAYRLLVDTTLYIMAIAVIAGALSSLLAEYGVVELLNRILSPLMRPLYGMPGASALGIVTTYLSDNPAILTLADNRAFRRYFKAYQIPALTNLGTAFGMGLIVTTFMLGLDVPKVGLAVLCGNLGTVAGSIVSTRLMLRHTAKAYGKTAPADLSAAKETRQTSQEPKAKGFVRVLNALMEGGRKGVGLGLGIIPGVLVICTLVMMLTKGPGDGGVYTGKAFEGIALLPYLAGKLNFLLSPLFGFSSAEAIAVPVTALGSAGAALGVIPSLLKGHLISSNDIAVFTAMCMCWSGYLSTHVSMMDVLGCNKMTGKAILSHTVGGLCAGIFAHWLFMAAQLL